MNAITLSPSELIFAQRMLPHFMAGQSAVEAAEAVIADDARIFTEFSKRAYDYCVGDDFTGTTHRTREGEGDVIAKDITRTVYGLLRATSVLA
ncbi:hypothetical protein [Mesorhizobium sp. B2-1-3A]|uniref:hypothetical protein n=1 Tax=Mesorhizobium sp. B2-1-3A TaxID=2589971 RepID=UPI00112B72FF|nr:hypothetical protein [Mesorhizobium sp. B2-1-3A]TPM89837.1 hypothetical protein FJ977_35235 [Mesorhizobium sp. B2-1-3A]